jgi:P-loop containing dynein motor region D4
MTLSSQHHNTQHQQAFFVERVRTNLHVVLCLSPIGDAFRTRLRMFPSLVNCCTIDWFAPWPQDALRSVARHFLDPVCDYPSLFFMYYTKYLLSLCVPATCVSSALECEDAHKLKPSLTDFALQRMPD